MNGLILSMLLAAPAAAGQAPPPITHFEALSNPAKPDGALDELAMASDGQDRMTVAVALGTSRPYRFLVDTGSNRTSVSHQLARELGLQERGNAQVHTTTGRSQVRMAYLPQLQVNRRTVRGINAPLLDAANIGADGILGIDSLRSQRVVFDFAAGKLSVHSGDAPGAIEEGAIIVRAKRRQGRLIVTNAEVDGVRVSVVLDSGSSLTVGNAALRRKLERRRPANSMGPIDLISVTGAALRAELVAVGNLDIGGARLEGLVVAFADAHTFSQLELDRKPAILLGMNALRGFERVTIDFADKTVSLVLPKARKPA